MDGGSRMGFSPAPGTPVRDDDAIMVEMASPGRGSSEPRTPSSLGTILESDQEDRYDFSPAAVANAEAAMSRMAVTTPPPHFHQTTPTYGEPSSDFEAWASYVSQFRPVLGQGASGGGGTEASTYSHVRTLDFDAVATPSATEGVTEVRSSDYWNPSAPPFYSTASVRIDPPSPTRYQQLQQQQQQQLLQQQRQMEMCYNNNSYMYSAFSPLAMSVPPTTGRSLAMSVPTMGTVNSSRNARNAPFKPGRECKFCRNNGESPESYRSHVLRNPSTGQLICPVLREHRCEECGATGDNAHTRSYCPKVKMEQKKSLPTLLKETKRQSDGTIRKNAAGGGGRL